MQTLNPTATDEVRPDLGADEHLLWSGQPYAGLMLRNSDWLQIPFSLMWCGFAVFWEYSVLSKPHAPLFMQLWGIPFVAVGLYIVAGRFFAEAWQRNHTHYALTDERLIIVTKLFTRKVRSLPLRLLPQLTLDLREDGSGSISFATPESRHARAMWGGLSTADTAPRFERIADARAVHQLIRDAQARALRAQP